MSKTAKALAAALGAASLITGAAQANPADGDLSSFDVHAVDDWAGKLALCDATAFLASRPDFNAQQMWVRREDGHSDMLLPPDFVGGGWWYKEGYQRLSYKMKIEPARMHQAQNTLVRDFVETYRRSPNAQDHNFLLRQDGYCRQMARAEGEIIF